MMKSLCRWGMTLGWLFAISSGRLWAESSAKMVTMELNMECQDPGLCSLDLVRRLEATYGCQFEAKTPTDTVCGAVSIVHCDLMNPTVAQDPVCSAVASHGMNHLVTVTLYEAGEAPKGKRRSTLKPPAVMPAEQDVQAEVRKTPKAWARAQPLLNEQAAARLASQANREALKTKLGLTENEVETLKQMMQRQP